MALQSDGKIVVGGLFNVIGGQSRPFLARLSTGGSVDASFNANANNVVRSVIVQPDGKLVAGGEFTSVGGLTHNGIARLNPDGSIDTAFNADANNVVDALALQADGKLILGGYFDMANGQARNHVARLYADGTLDTTFNPDSNSLVYALALESDGKLLIGGSFDAIGGLSRRKIARLGNPQAAVQSLSMSGSTVTWLRSGASPELARPPQLQFSCNKGGNVSIGSMQRVTGGWSYSGLASPLAQNFCLSAVGQLGSGYGNASGGTIESTRQFYMDAIFSDGFE